ncbi:Uncharacterised protein [Citrobacter koseri]|nr:Uncharacterised protein [Citrobacter koseri]
MILKMVLFLLFQKRKRSLLTMLTQESGNNYWIEGIYHDYSCLSERVA